MELQKTDSYSKAYVEILEIINHMGEYYKEKIPSKLLKFFEDNKDANYSFDIENSENEHNPIFSQETIGLLSMLESKYWANDQEKKVIANALNKNEKRYQEELREKYNPENIFKNKDTKVKPIENTIAMVEYKASIFTKIKKWFKRTF